ncbi:MAG: hypothetical protein U9P10_01995 [Thermodesulfobacteriota bacterium]|nr:hypothetical protein [Thermodesulfobacteriota bacterium]
MRKTTYFFIVILSSFSMCFTWVCSASPKGNTIETLETSVKRYSVLPYKNKKVLCDPYTVSRNDWLYKIFRKKGTISEADFPLFLDIFKQINPKINNIDAIQPGQLILIPLKIIKKDDYRESSPGLVDVPIIKLSLTHDKIKPFIQSYRITPGDTVSELIDPVFLNKEGVLTAKGMHALKIANPSLKDPNLIYVGSTLFLPAPNLLSQNWFSALFSGHPHADTQEIRQPLTREKIKLTQQTKEALRQYVLKRKGDLLIKGRYFFPGKDGSEIMIDLETTPMAKFENRDRLIFIPRHLADTRDITDRLSQFYNNVKTMPIEDIVKKEVIIKKSEKKEKNLPKEKKAALIELICLTGLTYIRDAEISFFIGKAQIKTSLGKIVQNNKNEVFLNFGRIYGNAAFNALKEKNITMISFAPEETLIEMAGKLFKHLGISTTRNPAFVNRQGSAVPISGLYVKSGGQSREGSQHRQGVILAEEQLDFDSKSFLEKKNIAVLFLEPGDSQHPDDRDKIKID